MPRTHLTPASLPTDFNSLVRTHPPMAIRDQAAYDNAMEMISLLTSVPKLSKGQAQYLDTLSVLVEAYENEVMGRIPEGVDGIDVLRFLLDDRGWSASDLGRLLGDRSLGPKILNGQRGLSKAHITTLAETFHVGAGAFL